VNIWKEVASLASSSIGVHRILDLSLRDAGRFCLILVLVGTSVENHWPGLKPLSGTNQNLLQPRLGSVLGYFTGQHTVGWAARILTAGMTTSPESGAATIVSAWSVE
jgi:hypothetical protein